MKTVKLHFCDGKWREMMFVDAVIKNKSILPKYWFCPNCGGTIKNGKKAKGVMTVRKK